MNRAIGLLLGLLIAVAGHADPLDHVPALEYRVVDKRAHDPTLFTQGMAFLGDRLLESGGGYRASRVLLRPIDTPKPDIEVRLPASWFGEGIAILGNHAVVLTWMEGTAQELSLPALQRKRTFKYTGEGWGLTTDGQDYIQSNGSQVLVWRDPVDFSERRRVTVRADDKPLPKLNELEWVDGWILANVWRSDEIAVIDPQDGNVRAKLELHDLLSRKEAKRAEVLNGIAWHAASKRLWVSGKYWPWMFALELVLPSR